MSGGVLDEIKAMLSPTGAWAWAELGNKLRQRCANLNAIQGAGGKNTCAPLFHQITVGGQQ